jgi:hypothetical protein
LKKEPRRSGLPVGMERLTEDYLRVQRECEELRRTYLALAERHRWLGAVAHVVADTPARWWQRWLPWRAWRSLIFRQLSRRGLFDAAQYLSRNTDVARYGMDPLAHALAHGLAEGRPGLPAVSKPIAVTALSPALRDRIVASGLFDPEWYRANNPDVSPDFDEALASYLERSSNDPLHNPGPLFSGAHYLIENPDTISMHPLEHFVRFGFAEGRRGFSSANADAFMEGAADQPLESFEAFLDRDRETLVLHWADGNFFFTDIATYLADYLTRRGYRVRCLTDDSALMDEDCNLLVVAPHEYCIHGPGKDWPDKRFARAVYFNTEQWHTSWFSLALGVMLRSRMAIDINPASARGLRRLGIRAAFVPLLPSESPVFAFENAPLSEQTTARRFVRTLTWPESFDERPYDILFVGALNPRREAILAELAPVLARHDTFIHSPRLSGPASAGSGNTLPSHDVAQLARNARILLNIHQGESRYFEWHRVFVSGICEGCVVLTEPCVDTGILTPGVHYLECPATAMPDMLDHLLTTAEGRARLAEVRANFDALLASITAQGEIRT